MPILKIDYQKLTTIQEKKIDLERDLQRLTEANLETVFGYAFVAKRRMEISSFQIGSETEILLNS